MPDILASLGLSEADRAARKSAIGGSDANIIMAGDPDKLLKLWREKRGEVEADDLSSILAVQMGSFTEPLNVAWYEKQTGNSVTARGDIRQHGIHTFMRCTLDGIVCDPFGEVGADQIAVFEAKHVGTRSTDAEVFARYVPQLTHNCLCSDLPSAVLSVFKGNGDWAMFEYDVDAGYANALIAAEANFWSCVQTGEPPVPLPLPPAPKPKGVKEYDMSGSNSWATFAAEYLETALAADRHEIAKKELKILVPDDASKAFGAGITINRDKRGALRFATKEN